MRTRIAGPVALLAVLLLSAPTVSAEDAAVVQKLIETKAAPVVSVKFVLRVKVSRDGQMLMPETDNNGSASGVVVDASGLVMLQASAFNPSLRFGRRNRMMQGIDVSAVPSNIRVIFPGDTREYPAVLGAKDSKLGLAFVLIKDLGEKKVPVVNMEQVTEPQVGQVLYGISRLEQGFDYAPMCTRVEVTGSVTKPRSLWIVRDAGGLVGMPLFDAAGAVAGVVIRQEGVGEDAGTRPFLLPLKVARPTVAGALKKSKDELERILDEEAEQGGAEGEGGGEGDDDEGKKGGGEEGDKDDGE